MATSIEEALAEAKVELLTREYVIDAEIDETVSENKPCNYVRKRFNVLHKMPQGDYTFSGKEIYINKLNFTYKWHYGGGELSSTSTPFRDLVESKIPILKSGLGVDWAEIMAIDEINESGLVYAIKGTTGNLAETWTIKTWKTGETSVGYKIIAKKTVA
jgi:hypothetical protein